MPAVSRPPREAAPPVAGSEAPDWDTPVSTTASNADVIALLVGGQVDDPTASSLLGDVSGVAPADPSWAVDGEEQGQQQSGRTLASAEDETSGAPPPGPQGDVLRRQYGEHEASLKKMKLTLSRAQLTELAAFKAGWTKNQARYEAVAAKTGVPARLIAAIHYREASLNWNTYLHQGDPLGKKAVHVPKDIPIFYVWEDAAVHALNMKRGIATAVGLTEDSTDEAAMATYAEAYNGMGYDNRGLNSPYVYGGSDQYTGGHYVADHKFSSRAFDKRLGTATLLESMDDAPGTTATAARPKSGWSQVLGGDVALKRGSRGDGVLALQEKLAATGQAVDVDGAFGAGTEEAVRAFQVSAGLRPDGVVGTGTAAALEKGCCTVNPATLAWKAVRDGGTILRSGDRGDAIEALQERLRAKGYAIAADGVFGRGTRAAVIDFQDAHRLQVDGQVGKDTAAAIDRATGR